MAWTGTVFAGGVFGMIAGSVFGLFIGPVFAGFFGVPTIVSFAIFTWAFWLTRFSVLMAALAGGCTGFIATALMWDSIFETDFPTSLLLASLIGAIGGGVTGWYGQSKGGDAPLLLVSSQARGTTRCAICFIDLRWPRCSSPAGHLP